MRAHYQKGLWILLSIFVIGCEAEYVKPIKITYQHQQIDNTLASDADLEAFIKPYKNKIESEMNTVLSYAPVSLSKTDSRYNTALGNMMADAVMELANPIFKERHNLQIDAVLLNYGGIRSGINEGDITVQTAYDLMPFENEVVVVALPYSAVQEMVSYLIDKKVAHPISGMQIHLEHDYSLHNASIQGEEIKLNDQKEKVFYIATSDYLLQGGDNMEFFAKNENVFSLDYKIRNLLIDYFGKKDTVEAQQDQRFLVNPLK